MEGAPSEANGEGNALSSPTTKIAKQNRTAEEPEWAAELYRIHSAFEDAVWQSEVRRKRGSGGRGHEMPCSRHVYGNLRKKKETKQRKKTKKENQI